MDGAGGLKALHARLLDDRSLQFTYSTVAAPRQEPLPAWLKALGLFMKGFVTALPVLKVLFWIGLGVAVLFLALLIAREMFGVRLDFRRKAPPARAAPADWRPEAWKARALLEDADRLAAEGDFDRAARLLLRRGVEDIEARRPRLIRPALTAREIAVLEGVPEGVRDAFARIARAVEASWFGARSLSPEEFADCRRPYESFAFPEAWG